MGELTHSKAGLPRFFGMVYAKWPRVTSACDVYLPFLSRSMSRIVSSVVRRRVISSILPPSGTTVPGPSSLPRWVGVCVGALGLLLGLLSVDAGSFLRADDGDGS